MPLLILPLILILGLFAGGMFYIASRSARFPFIEKIAASRKHAATALCLLAYAAMGGLLILVWDPLNAVICMVHLILFWLLCDCLHFLYRKLRKQPPGRYYTGLAAIALCVIYLTCGYIAAHHIRKTTYTFSSPKLSSDLCIVQLTDVHMGTTFHAEGFIDLLAEINTLSPDAVVLIGDFVDDDTSREDLFAACDALSGLKTRYGVFFVWGNHDPGYNDEESRGWSFPEYRQRLLDNGVILLEDEAALVTEELYIVGRKDRSQYRMGAEALLSGLDHSKYILMLDHQPADFDREAAAGADLVLCGHTHGGQMIPIQFLGEWLGINDLRYGHERRQGTDFIVSSGVSCWRVKFKTGCFSEYVVIRLQAS